MFVEDSMSRKIWDSISPRCFIIITVLVIVYIVFNFIFIYVFREGDLKREFIPSSTEDESEYAFENEPPSLTINSTNGSVHNNSSSRIFECEGKYYNLFEDKESVLQALYSIGYPRKIKSIPPNIEVIVPDSAEEGNYKSGGVWVKKTNWLYQLWKDFITDADQKTPEELKKDYKMALIIPFRESKVKAQELGRCTHLQILISYMRFFLEGYRYHIVVVEQDHEEPFNRALCLNIGALESPEDTDYYLLHDVDQIPENNVEYLFDDLIVHHGGSVSSLKYFVGYSYQMGGVTMIPKRIWETVTKGMSNNFWKWGGEDDNLYYRLLRYWKKIYGDKWFKENKMRAEKLYLRSPLRMYSLPHILERKRPENKKNQKLKVKDLSSGMDLRRGKHYKILKVQQGGFYSVISIQVDRKSIDAIKTI